MRKSRVVMITAVILLLMLLFCTTALAEEDVPDDLSIEDGVEQWLRDLGLDQWQYALDANASNTVDPWKRWNISEMVRTFALTGDFSDEIFGKDLLWAIVRQQAAKCVGLLLTLIGIASLTSFASVINADGKDSTTEAAGFACRCFTLAVVLSVFADLVKNSIDAIGMLSDFMQIALPALLTLLTAMGATATTGAIQPATTFLCGGVTTMMQRVVVPIALCGGIAGVLNCLGKGNRLGGLSMLAKKTVKWAVGITTSLYLGITSVRGLAAASYDGISIRTAKYAASNLVPFVGGFVSGTMDTLVGCAGLVKNAAGTTAILIAASIVFLPMLRIFVYMSMFRISIALTQPIADKTQITMQTEATEMLSCILAAMIATTLMFIVTTGLITSVGNNV